MAVAVPVLDGKIGSWQFIVTLAGQVITGGVTSWMVMVWMQVEELPQASVAVHVRVIT